MRHVLIFLQKLSLGGLLVVLSVVIGIGLVTTALKQTLNRNNVKDWLDNPSAHQLLVTAISQHLQTQLTNAPREQANAIRPEAAEVEQTLARLLPRETYSGAVVAVTDGIFDWAEGKTARPEFEFELVKDEQHFIELMTVALMQKINNLPPCEADYAPTPQTTLFNIPCRPPELDEKAVNEYLTSRQGKPEFQQFYERVSTINSRNLNLNTPAVRQGPQLFELLRLTGAVLAIMGLLLFLLICLATWSVAQGLRLSGRTLLRVALLSAVGVVAAWLARGWWQPQLIGRLPSTAPSAARELSANLLGLMYNELAMNVVLASLIVAAGACGPLWLSKLITRRKAFLLKAQNQAHPHSAAQDRV